jgi:Cysteine rich repeat
MKKLHVVLSVLLSMSIVTAVYAYAEDVNPCEGDIAKFCKNVERGEGRILRCLTLSEEKLTPACEKQVGQIKKAVDEVQRACVDDYAIFCSSLLPGQGRIAACLEKNEKILAPKCKAVLKEVKQKAREIQKQMKKKKNTEQ